MATYMKMDKITGDVTAKGHENWIEIDDLYFGIKRHINTEPGRVIDREGTRPSISNLTLTKRIDKSSPLLFSEACVGKSLPSVKLDICQTDDSLNPYTQLTLNNVIVSSYELSSIKEDEPSSKSNLHSQAWPMEKISLSYDRIEIKYIPYGTDNKPQSPIPAGYDLKAATAT